MANVFLKKTVGSSDSVILASQAYVYGDVAGQEEVTIVPNGSTLPLGFEISQTIEKVTLSGALSDFTFQKSGTTDVLVYKGADLVATIRPQTSDDVGSNGTVLAFTSGDMQETTLNIISATEMRIGGASGQILTTTATAYAPPTFTVTDTGGTVTFGGAATGNITFTTSGTIATFSRGGIADTTNTVDFSSGFTKITVGASQTLAATAAQVTGKTIDGVGTVAVTALQSALGADLSAITAATVTAAVTTATASPVLLTGDFNFGKAAVTISGDGEFIVDSATMGTATFNVGADAKLNGKHVNLSGKTITGTGHTGVELAADTDVSHFASTLHVQGIVSDNSVDISTNTNLGNVDLFTIDENHTLTLTADQANGREIQDKNTTGNVVVTASTGAQTLHIATTGTNTITPGAGLDQVTLGSGADTVVIGGASGLDPSTALIDTTNVQSGTAATFGATIGGVVVADLDVSAATDGTTLATALQTALRAADGGATNISVAWSGDVLTISDAAHRAISGVTLIDGGTAATETMAAIDATDVQSGTAATFGATIGGVVVAGVDVGAATDGATLATALQSALRAADGDATDISVAWSGDVLTITDAAHRAISGVTLVDGGTALDPSTALIDATDVQSGTAAIFGATIGGVVVADVDVGAAIDGATLATALQSALRAADGDATDISVAWSGDVLTISDAAHRVISGVTLVDGGTAATQTTAAIDATDVQSGTAATFGATIGGVVVAGVDVGAATDGATLATALQSALRAADGDATDISVAWSGDVLTIIDAAHRAISGVTLVDGTAAAIDASIAIGDNAIAAAAVDSSITLHTGAAAIAPAAVDASVTIGDNAVAAAAIDSIITLHTGAAAVLPVAIDASIAIGGNAITATAIDGSITLHTGAAAVAPAAIDESITIGDDTVAAAAIDSVITLHTGAAADTVSDSAPGYGGVAHSIDIITGFAVGSDYLQLGGGTGVQGNGTTVVGDQSITITDGMVTATTETSGDALISELLELVGATHNTVAFHDGNGGAYILQGDGISGGQTSDIVVHLVGINGTLDNLSAILSAA
jgi:hypothetical protein